MAVDISKTRVIGPKPVLPKFGRTGGGTEYILPNGTPPGSVGPPQIKYQRIYMEALSHSHDSCVEKEKRWVLMDLVYV